MYGTFNGCTSLKTANINYIKFNSSSLVGGDFEWSGLFGGCSSLEKIYCNKDLRNVLSAEKSKNMFQGCTSLPN